MSDNTMKINNTGVSLSDDLEEVQEAQVIKSTVGQEIDNEIDNEPEETENEDVDIVEVDMKEPMKSKRNKRHQTVDIYHNTMITKKVSVPISNIGIPILLIGTDTFFVIMVL
tara:strand:- start:289 stop:624 length:336 start_codon:yes stop_codon:yes gene_type:complete